MSKAYLNALAEEGTRQDLIDWLCKLDAENDRLRDAAKALLDDVRRRYPGEELRCEFMRALDEATK